MGRGASKHEALEEVLTKLERLAKEHVVALGYNKHGLQRRNVELAAPVKVLGKMGSNNLEAAQPIIAKRIKMSGKPTFDPRPFLDERSKNLYEDPIGHACSLEDFDGELPAVKVHATHKEKVSLLKKLDDTQRLVIAREHEVREYAANGLFTVVKDLEYDRLILDGRRPNALQPPLNRWIMSMAAGSNLLDISLEPSEDLLMSGDDLKDYYYMFEVNHSRACRNFLAGPLRGRDAMQFASCPSDVGEDELVYACLKSLAMGDCSACEFAQTAHLSLGLRSRAFKLEQLLTLRGRVPRTSFIAGIVIDDMIFMEKIQKTETLVPEMSQEAKKRIAAMEAQYSAVGLETHPKKSFRDSLEASFWGAHVDGKAGLVRANPQRVIPMMSIVCRTLQLGCASVGLLEAIAGVFISIFTFRRRLFSLLNEIYQLPSSLDRHSQWRTYELASALTSTWLMQATGEMR